MNSERSRQSSAEAGRSRAPSLVGPGVGQAVEVQGSRGIIRFSGTTEFATGRWLGVELEGPHGKNDGSVQGKRYFECQTDHGVFVRSSQVKVLMTSSSGGSGDGSAGVGGDAAGQQQGGSRLLRSTIHGAEVQQGAGEQRLRPPAAATEGLRAVRRATMQPGRTMAPAAFGGPPAGAVSAQSSIMATPAGGSRLGGPLGQRPALSGQAGQTPSGIGSGPIGVAGSASALQKARRISDVQSLGPRRATLSGARSPGIPGGRSSSRQTVG
ncbi:hypothetical protein GGI02_004927, partial [Coemansia sp. RSA 2322]